MSSSVRLWFDNRRRRPRPLPPLLPLRDTEAILFILSAVNAFCDGGCADNCNEDKLLTFHELIEFKSPLLVDVDADVDVDVDADADDDDEPPPALFKLAKMEVLCIAAFVVEMLLFILTTMTIVITRTTRHISFL